MKLIRFVPLMNCLALLVSVPERAQAEGAPATKGEAIPSRSVGEAAPPFMLKLMNPQPGGEQVFDIRNHVGEDPQRPAKLVVMAFFATWCKPCRKELPTLVRLDEKYREKGLKVVSIAIDREADAIAQIPEILKENKVVHPVVSDSLNIVARRYLGSETKLPSVVLVGADGNIVALHQGYGDEVQAAFEGEVESALGVPKAAKKR